VSVGTLTPTARPAPVRVTLAAVRSPAGVVLLGLIALGAALRFTRIGHQGFWFDEGNTALLISYSPGKMLGLIPHTESTPPLYYSLVWLWARVFGHAEAGLRSFSAIAGVAVIPVAYAAATKLVSRRTGLIVAALTACNPFLIWYSQEARSYSLLVLLSACSLLAFAYARADPRPRPLALWVIACALALLTHYYAVVVVVPQAAWLLYEHRRARSVWIALGAVGLCGLALVPLIVSQSGTGNDSWIAHAPLGPRLRQILPQFLIGTNAPARQTLKYVAFALGLVGLALLASRTARGRPEWRGALLAAGLAVAGFALALIFVAVGQDTLITRNILGLWLPAAIALGGGLSAIGDGPRLRTVGITATVGLCVIGIVATVAVATERSMQRPDWRYVSRALGPAPPASDRAVTGRALLIQHYRTLLPLSLYQPRVHYLVSRSGATVRELDVISMVSPSQPLCWWGAACNLIPSAMQRSYAIPGFHEVSRRHVLQWTILRLVSDRPVRLTPAMVSAALDTTSLRRDELLLQRRG
jgi:mannosyltransferase